MLAMFRLVLIGATVSAVVPLAHAQLITHRDLSYAIAKTIAETAIDSCKANGYSVSAVVVDRAGEVIVALRGDNAGPHTMENARRKAYTAPPDERPRPARLRLNDPHAGGWVNQEAAIHFGSSPAQASSSRSAFASFRSAVSNPSVNHL
jgi:hypothetical protein